MSFEDEYRRQHIPIKIRNLTPWEMAAKHKAIMDRLHDLRTMRLAENAVRGIDSREDPLLEIVDLIKTRFFELSWRPLDGIPKAKLTPLWDPRTSSGMARRTSYRLRGRWVIRTVHRKSWFGKVRSAKSAREKA